MPDRAFVTLVAAGLLAVVAVAGWQATAPSRLRSRAHQEGLASVELAVREMG